MQKPEQPERNLVADADFGVVVDDITRRDVLDLVKSLARAADLKMPCVINQEIPNARKHRRMILTHLIVEEGLPRRTAVRARRQRIHHVRVVAVDLLGFRQVLKVLTLRGNGRQQGPAIKCAEDLKR